MRIARMSHVSLRSRDLDRQVRYYRDVIGLSELDRTGEAVHLGTQFGLPAVSLDRGGEDGIQGLTFELDSRDGLGLAAERLRSLGVDASQSAASAHPAAGTALAFRDPSGVRVELVTAVPFAPRSAPAGIGALKLGHVAMLTRSYQPTVDFYTEALGFRVSDRIEGNFAFLRCGPDHHSVNIAEGGRTGLHHLAFEVLDRAALLAACDHLGARGVDLLWGPGRAGAGHNLAVYHRTPDGSITEIYTEMDRMTDPEERFFDPRPWHRDMPQRPKVWTEADRLSEWGTPMPDGFMA